MRRLIITALIGATTLLTSRTLAQDGAAAACAQNNLKQIVIAPIDYSKNPPLGLRNLARDLSGDVSVCAAPSGLMLFVDGAGPFPAQAQGCQANVAEAGLGDNVQVGSLRRSDGRIEIRVRSSRERGCRVTAILPFMEQDALPAAGGRAAQAGGGIYNEGTLTLTGSVLVGAGDDATRALIRDRKTGPGRMTIVVPRDSELAALFRSSLSGNRRIAKAEVRFAHALLAEVGFPASADGKVILEDIRIERIRGGATAAGDDRPTEEVAFYYTKVTW